MRSLLICLIALSTLSTHLQGKDTPRKKGSAQTGSEKSLDEKISSISPEFEADMTEAVVAFFRNPNNIGEGSELSRTESIESANIPDALRNRVIELAKIPQGESILQIQIADDWHSTPLGSFEPHRMGVFTDKAVYFSGTWAQRRTRGFYMDRVPYKDFLLTTKFNYNRQQEEEDGVAEFVGAKTIRSTSEVVRLLHYTSLIIKNVGAEAVKNAVAKANALPEADVRAIKGYNSVLWGASIKEAREKLGLNVDKYVKIIDYAGLKASEVTQAWAHYQRTYPGIRLTTPLSTIQANDTSGLLTLHFPGGKLGMVEREVSADIKKHSVDALANMLAKYGEASREICDFKIEGDRAIRFTWETKYGRIIALCDAWYPDHKPSDRVAIGGNELQCNLNVVGNGYAAKLHKDSFESESWIAPDSNQKDDPDVKKTTGTFVQLKLRLKNKNHIQSWPFKGTVEMQLITLETMKVITAVSPLTVTGKEIEYTLAPDDVNIVRNKSEQTFSLLFDIPLDKFANIPSFCRLAVTPAEKKVPVYTDFSVNLGSIVPIQELFSTLKPVKSGSLSEFIPENMRMSLISIGYSDGALLKDIAKVDSEALKTAREEAEKKETVEREKVKVKSSKDL